MDTVVCYLVTNKHHKATLGELGQVANHAQATDRDEQGSVLHSLLSVAERGRLHG